jgi:hypothetical protein
MTAENDEKLANAILSLVDELGQSRIIQEDMAKTLVAIHAGQEQIAQQFAQVTERQNDHSRRVGDSENKIRVLDSKWSQYAERTEKRLEHLEAHLPGPQAAAE